MVKTVKQFLLLLIMNLLCLTGLSWQGEIKLMEAESNARARGDWERAAQCVMQLIKQYDSIDVNSARSYISLAMYLCNMGDYGNAKNAVKNAIYLMKNGSRLKGGCEDGAEAFLAMLNRGARFKFSQTEFNTCHQIIMSPADEAFNNAINAEIMRSNMLMMSFKNEINKLKRQRRRYR